MDRIGRRRLMSPKGWIVLGVCFEFGETARPPLADMGVTMQGELDKERTETEQRLRVAEERLTRDIRTKVFLFSLVAVMSAVGAMLIGSFVVTRDVNSSVIALQRDLIAAQTALKTASDALVEQRQGT